MPPVLPAATGPSAFDPGAPTTTTSDDGDTTCQFCRIAAAYPSYDPCAPPPATSPLVAPSATQPAPPAFVVLSTPLCVAFLDIMPLSAGHVLLCPRAHRRKLTDARRAEAAALGAWLRVLSAAVARATGVHDWNVVQNNGAAAAQVVPHMHFHVIPRPGLRAVGRERFTATMFGRGRREDLDDEEGGRLAEVKGQDLFNGQRHGQDCSVMYS
ncbi:hypothetical protein P8C59_000510 [Phyllachora maydis]|uniref:HIT domain-containing protein n=1 Tax=Phyllachora maydis TaxID=1825666 RepID=A0AAD9M8Y0_9PEZI|nr:hypothetical protein P8C59_000510 [Phyllachora maydis]